MVTQKKLLVVDDDEILLDMYKERLQMSGYDVTAVTNGSAALKQVEKLMPDVILLDIMMPKISGFDVLKKLKDNDKTKNIPVIILTALSQENNRKQGMQMGASDFIIKAETMPKDVVAKIEKFIK